MPFNVERRCMFLKQCRKNRAFAYTRHTDLTGRRLTSTDIGPLFANIDKQEDIVTGTIYVLGSQSTLFYMIHHRELIHTIDVVCGKVETHISGAKKDATWLSASFEVIAT
jgi:hypothetical protein